MFWSISRVSRRPFLISAAAAIAIQDRSHDQEKLSIYPQPPQEILLLETPSTLEKNIGIARRTVTHGYHDAYAHVQGVVSRWIGVEHAVENRVKSIISPSESLTPGLLYVGISTLTGSILARNRIIATRLLLPPVFLIASLNHFLPQTAANLSAYFASLEDTYFPTFAEKHDIANAHTRMTWERVKAATEGGREGLTKGVEGAVGKVQGWTGLKLRESLGWDQVTTTDIVQATEKKIEAKLGLEGKIDDFKASVDTKVEDVKRLV